MEMNRRDFLRYTALGTLAATPAMHLACPRVPAGVVPDTTIVDAHCHTFNARDIPIDGFVKKTVLPGLGFDIAPLVAAVDFQLSLGAPGFVRESALLDDLLEGKAAPPPLPKRNLETEFAGFLEWLARNDPSVYATIPSKQRQPTGVIAQVFQWAGELASSRYDTTRRLVDTYPEVNLFTPALIDFGPWVEDNPATSMARQIQLGEKIVRLFEGRVHPMVGFDPLRDAQFLGFADNSPFAWVRRAVEEMGFLGVKMYPPMGFRPSGNEEVRPPELGAIGIEKSLERLFEWCAAEDVPVMVHGAGSYASRPDRGERADPRHWERVLERHPGLRLNLGHFGGDFQFVLEEFESWGFYIGRLMRDYERVFADTSFSEFGLASTPFDDRDAFSDSYLSLLDSFYASYPVARERLLYGSDWHVLLVSAGASDYLRSFVARFGAYFPRELNAVLGANALSWLGLDDPESGNRRRLATFYQKYGISAPGYLDAPGNVV